MMFNKLLESLSAALLLTAASYAVGIVQTKSLFRSLGIQPELISINVEKALYDGGMIVFVYGAKIFFGVLISAAAIITITMITNKRATLSAINTHAGKLFPALLIFAIYFITTYSYGDAKIKGEKLSETLIETCTLITIKTENSTYTKKCSLIKTNGFIWIYDKEIDKAIAVAEEKIEEIIAEE